MVKPWLEAGYDCTIVDLQHPKGESVRAKDAYSSSAPFTKSKRAASDFSSKSRTLIARIP